MFQFPFSLNFASIAFYYLLYESFLLNTKVHSQVKGSNSLTSYAKVGSDSISNFP